MPFLGIDSKLHSYDILSRNQNLSFAGMIAVVINVLDNEKFEDVYDNIINETLEEWPLERTKQIYKSKDLAELIFPFDNQKFLALLSKIFAKSIIKGNEIFRINFVFSTINEKLLKNNAVTIYGYKEVTVKKFQSLLSGYFNYIAAWKFLDSLSWINADVFVDGIDGIQSPAWLDLVKKHNVHVVPQGDLLNKAISLSDIISRWLSEVLLNNKLYLSEKDIYEAIKRLYQNHDIKYSEDMFSVFYVGNPDLAMIVPSSTGRIHLSKYYQRPIMWVYKESPNKYERTVFENSPKFQYFINEAIERKASILFYDNNEHSSMIEDDDIFAIYGDNGKNYVRSLLDMGYNVLSLT